MNRHCVVITIIIIPEHGWIGESGDSMIWLIIWWIFYNRTDLNNYDYNINVSLCSYNMYWQGHVLVEVPYILSPIINRCCYISQERIIIDMVTFSVRRHLFNIFGSSFECQWFAKVSKFPDTGGCSCYHLYYSSYVRSFPHLPLFFPLFLVLMRQKNPKNAALTCCWEFWKHKALCPDNSSFLQN